MDDVEEAYLEKWDMTNYPKKPIIVIDRSIIDAPIISDAADINAKLQTQNTGVNNSVLKRSECEVEQLNSVGDSRRSLDENVCEAKIIEVDEVNPENVSQNMRYPSVDLYKETLNEIINRLQLENTLLKNNNVTLRRYLKLALQSIDMLTEYNGINTVFRANDVPLRMIYKTHIEPITCQQIHHIIRTYFTYNNLVLGIVHDHPIPEKKIEHMCANLKW
jgi:hypothetical protein